MTRIILRKNSTIEKEEIEEITNIVTNVVDISSRMLLVEATDEQILLFEKQFPEWIHSPEIKYQIV